MEKQGKNGQKALPPYVLVRFQRKGFSMEDHLKRAGLPEGRYVHLNGDWAAYGLQDDDRFRRANYLAVTGVGEVLGGGREMKAREAKPKAPKAGKPAKKGAKKNVTKNGIPPKVKNPAGRAAGAA